MTQPRAPGKKFTLTRKDVQMEDLVREADHKTLAVWAIDCAERVMPFFEETFPDDPRPRNAIITLQAWIDTGVFRMADIRGASLASHAAARDVGKDTAARSSARAAGQAVATAHVKTHAPGAALYAQQAVWRAANLPEAEAAVARERDWQVRRLLKLKEKTASKK